MLVPILFVRRDKGEEVLKKYINSAHSLNNRGIQKCVQRQIFQNTFFLNQYLSKINVLHWSDSCFSLSQPYISHSKFFFTNN